MYLPYRITSIVKESAGDTINYKDKSYEQGKGKGKRYLRILNLNRNEKGRDEKRRGVTKPSIRKHNHSQVMCLVTCLLCEVSPITFLNLFF